MWISTYTKSILISYYAIKRDILLLYVSISTMRLRVSEKLIALHISYHNATKTKIKNRKK